MSNISLIKLSIIIRISLWYFVLLTCSITHTLFIIQTWSKIFIFILILNLIFSIINFRIYKHPEYYQKFKYILVICLSLLTFSTLIIYIIYIFNIYYHIMNLLTINIMTNDRNESLLSNTLNYYQCCRIQEDILFDSVNERDYFILFSNCEKLIIENEIQKDHWNNIKTCGSIFRSIIFYVRLFFILDFILNFILMIQSLVYILEENYQWIDDNQYTISRTNNINYKKK